MKKETIMCNYFKDFKKERFHDENLIEILKVLSENNRIDLFESLIGANHGDLGLYKWGSKKRDFDILLEFENYNILIETKVDSPEGNTKGLWQTDKIYKNFINRWNDKKLIFIYLTYGLSEFYIKEKSNGEYRNGAYNNIFIHIICSQIYNFINQSINECSITDNRLITWRDWIQFEIIKRNDNVEYLKNINEILKRYKTTLNLTDYPVNRLNLFLPEFTIPYYYKLCVAWNNKNNIKIGKACLYPVGRLYAPSNDSILNFWELWDSKEVLTCNYMLNDNYLYFEFNEDFNLHLKATDNIPDIAEIKQFVSNRFEALSNGFNGIIENFHQGSYVLYEWDLNILSNSINNNLKNIEAVLINAIEILK